MKPKDVKNENNRAYIDEYNKKSARFNVNDRVKISKFKNIFAKKFFLKFKKYILLIGVK